jgi:hypothetical protein
MTALVVLLATPASAATWINPRTTPHLNEIVAIDKTGEANWIYGAEDVLGDGLNMFGQPEQSLDLRTAYAATDMTRFWVRVYVSDPMAVGVNVTVFVFIDADKNPATGGKTNSTVLSPAFTADVSPGGYEYVVGLRGNGMMASIWEWRANMMAYNPLTLMPMDVVAEIGRDLDPIRINADQHGYVQGAVNLGLVGLTPPCNANLYVRSANAMGPSDLDMSFTTSCVPADANGDKIPDILVPPMGCTSNAQCPQGGVCANGMCVLAPACVSDANCPNGYTCTADGRCVPKGGMTCTSNAQCNGLVCVNGACAPCTQGSNQCGGSQVCAPNGTCVNGTGPTGGNVTGQVEGGAFNCGVTTSSGDGVALVIVGSLMLLLRSRRRRSA